MSREQILAGAGRAAVAIPEEFFPMEKFVGIHDCQQVRAVLFEREARIAIVSVEITSIMADAIEEMKDIVCESGQVERENIWICATHTFAAPHLLGGPMLERASKEEIIRGAMYKTALYEAVRRAAGAAAENMRPARLLFGRGECDVNINRDIPSEEGWWIGMNPEGPSDKTLRVIRVEDLAGNAIAVLYHYGVQSSIMDNVFDRAGGRLITSDLTGAASRVVEENLADCILHTAAQSRADGMCSAASESQAGGPVCLCLLGACGDQVPKQRARYWTTDDENCLVEKDLGEAKGFEMIASLGGQLGQVVLQIMKYGLTEIEHPILSMSSRKISCAAQKKQFEGFPVPSKTFESIPDGEAETEVFFMKLAENMLAVGVKPELNCVTAAEIEKQSAYEDTLVVQMVNGAQKYMADEQSFARKTYESMNSFFGRGAAEKLTEEIVKEKIAK